jgi:gas vesicle protein
MTSAQNDTFDTTRNGAGNSVGDGGNASTLSSLMDSLGTVTTVYSLLRKIGLPSPLSLFSLARKKGSFGTLVLFGTGLAVGAGAALMLTPIPGAELRRTLLERIKGLSGEAKRSIVNAEHKAEEIAIHAKDSVIETEHKIEHKVHDLVDEVKAVLQSSGHYAELRKAGTSNGKSNGHSNGNGHGNGHGKYNIPAGAAGTAVN